MRKLSALCLVVLVCSGVAIVSAQKKPATRQPDKVAPSQRQAASPEQNKVVVRRVFEDLFTHGRYEFIDQIYEKGCPVHFGNRHVRLEDAVSEGKGWRNAAPDLLMTVDHMVAEGDKVTVDWTAKGTHTGKGNGISPTGKHVLIHGRSTFRLANGKIVEVWNTDHRDELFRQLGVSKTQAWLYEKGEDLWLAVRDFFSPAEPASASVPSSTQ
ncbi:MAG TPA: ester cyclase [Candidatus Acidoferrales bacterium]|nr:ester cyclase [Candidatus Acidoferrales bacterium]